MTLNEKLKAVAADAAGMGVVHQETVAVVETFNGEVVWQGAVSTFWGRDCTVYAWAVQGEEEKPQYIAVLAGGKINSPIAAVRAWLASGKAGRSCGTFILINPN